MRIASLTFAGFSVLVAAIMWAGLALSPSRYEISFIAKTVVVLGTILAWSVASAQSLYYGKGLPSAFGLTGVLTTVVLAGWANHGTLRHENTFHPLADILRTSAGVYILVMWLVLLRATLTSSVDKNVTETNSAAPNARRNRRRYSQGISDQ